MGNEKEKSIIADALSDYKKIQEAAEASARKKLADEFPEKFQNFLKEELDNKNNKSDSKKTETYKKVDENESTDNLNESETKKDDTKMKKDEKKKEAKKAVNEERDKDFSGDVENDTPNLGKGETEDGVAYTEKTTTKKESNANKTSTKKGGEKVNEEFDVSDLDIDDATNAIDNAGGEDEIETTDDSITMEAIEEELSKIDQLQEEKKKQEEGDPYTEIVSMRDRLNEMISELDEQKNHGGKQNYKGRENGGPTTQMIDEREDYDDEQGEVPGEQDTGPDEYRNEQKEQGGKQNYKGRENGGPTNKMIDEEETISDEEIETAINDDEIDEAMGIAHSSSKHVAGDHLPGKDFAKHRHKRYGSVNNPKNEGAEKKLNSLLEQNKKLTKRINESKKYKETVDKLLESYKSAVEKYRSQLKEMAVFNSNLAHVNNLLVNESLALTQDDKVNIINDFKKVSSINESKEKYNKILSEMKDGKKTISENVEDKLTQTVGSSSKRKMDEVAETTVYENDEHINKIKKLIEYVERGDKKKII